MDIARLTKWKKDLMVKAWGKCKSLGSITTLSKSISSKHYLKRSFTTNDDDNKKKRKRIFMRKSRSQVAPEGCFSVYVGPEKQRFVVRAEFANHPLFAMLLEEAESEYGYDNNGPILLPCHVDLFYKVLAQMDRDHHHHDHGDDDDMIRASPGCALILCSPLNNGVSSSYRRLSSSRLLKMNQF